MKRTAKVFAAAIIALFAVMAACSRMIPAFAQALSYGGIKLPDPKLTPGAIRTTDASEICSPSFRTGPYRKTTSAMKHHVCAAYGVADCPKQGAMELDHLVPLELGGLDDEANLWVQLAPEFHWKDKLENVLHAKVCKTHELKLPEAQGCIVSNWVKCYAK